MKNVYILIPTLNPEESLVSYIKELKKRNFNNILVINDGSNSSKDYIFNEISNIDGCTVFRHAINLGKGRAMKNGFNIFMNLEDRDKYVGMIAVDSDGQHSVEDVEKIYEALIENPNSLIMGSRNFDGEDVPIKSSFGNKMTCKVFRILYGKKLKDTQTGLRGFPTNIIPSFIQLFGERFEYETSMLIECALKKIDIKEVDIKTIYIDNNSETHFRPIKDSLAIYNIIFKSFILYMCSSLLSFFVDIGFFSLFVYLFKSIFNFERYILLSTVAARIISSLFNYTVNKNIVFKSKSGKNTLIKYYVLCVIQMFISAKLVEIIYTATSIKETVIKIIVDTILFCISYQIQQRWVFLDNREN